MAAASSEAKSQVKMWVDEREHYKSDADWTNSTPPKGGVTGHFTQVVWADTERIGCARKKCGGLINPIFESWYLLPPPLLSRIVGCDLRWFGWLANTKCEGTLYATTKNVVTLRVNTQKMSSRRAQNPREISPSQRLPQQTPQRLRGMKRAVPVQR